MKVQSGYTPVLKERALDDQGNAVTPKVISERPGVLLVPGGDIPSDSILAITAITSIFDMEDYVETGEPVILSIGDSDILRCILKFPTLFGERFYVLEGVPGFEYRDYFTEATWGLPRMSYAALATDVAYARRVNEDAAIAAESDLQKERRRTRRKTGNAKAFTKFEVEEVGAHPPTESNSDAEEVPPEEQ